MDKNVKLIAYFLVALFGLSPAAYTQSMSPYDKCIIALDKDNIVAVKELASIIKNKVNVASRNLDKGETCLEAAFGENYAYSQRQKRWVSGGAAVGVEKVNELRAAQAAISYELRCLTKKRKAIEKLYLNVENDIRTKNNRLIETETVKACKDLHRDNAQLAILNPICRETFMVALHPDLKLQTQVELFEKLNKEKLEAANRENVLESKLGGLKDENSPLSTTALRPSLIEQAFTVCTGTPNP